MRKTKNSRSVASTNTAVESVNERYKKICSMGSIELAYNFTRDRIPNTDETKYTTVPNAFIQTLLSPITNRFEGSHPTELIAFRDITKLAPMFAATQAEIGIGSTGIKYDISAFLGTARKAVYKVTIISGGVLLNLDEEAMSNVAIAANFLCEPFARFPKIGSREYQQNCKNCSLSYSEISAFQQAHYSKIMGRTFTESASKTFTSDILVAFSLKPIFGFFSLYIGKASNYLLKKTFNGLTGVVLQDFGKARGPYEKAALSIQKANGLSGIKKVAVYTSYFLIEWPARTALEFSKSVIFVHIVSTVSDSAIADWLFGSSVEAGNTLTATAVAKGCAVWGASMPYCFAAGMTTKVVMSAAHKSRSKKVVEGMDYMFGSSTKTSVTAASTVISLKCMASVESNGAKAACIALGAVLLGLNSLDIEGSSIAKDTGDTVVSAFHAVTDAVHSYVEAPIGRGVYYLYESVKAPVGRAASYLSESTVVRSISSSCESAKVLASYLSENAAWRAISSSYEKVSLWCGNAKEYVESAISSSYDKYKGRCCRADCLFFV